MSRSILIAIALALFGTAVCRGNIYFIPGDAFFPSRLTADEVRAANEDQNSLVLGYDLPLRFAGFGGYAGFGRLEIRGLSKEMAHAVRDVYDHLRQSDRKQITVWTNKDGEEQSIETNGFHLFVYPKGVNWNQQKLGLKYNEDWMNLPAEAVAGPDRVSVFLGTEPEKPLNTADHYYSLIGTWKSVAEDWQYSKRFAGLPVKVPQGISWGLMHEDISTPVTIDAKQIQLVILAEEKLKSYFDENASCEFYSITDDKVERLHWRKNGKLSITPWPSADGKSRDAAEPAASLAE